MAMMSPFLGVIRVRVGLSFHIPIAVRIIVASVTTYHRYYNMHRSHRRYRHSIPSVMHLWSHPSYCDYDIADEMVASVTAAYIVNLFTSLPHPPAAFWLLYTVEIYIGLLRRVVIELPACMTTMTTPGERWWQIWKQLRRRSQSLLPKSRLKIFAAAEPNMNISIVIHDNVSSNQSCRKKVKKQWKQIIRSSSVTLSVTVRINHAK